MAGKPYPVQQFTNAPHPINMQYNQAPYNPNPYPPQSAAYPPQQNPSYPMQHAIGGGAYPPSAPAEPPPPYYATDPYPHQSAAYPPRVQTGYPPQPSHYPVHTIAAYPPGVQVTGQYDSSARFGAGASHNIPPPPPGVMPNAAQIANMRGSSVHMSQKPAGWFEGHSSGGTTFW